jgi:hypothetical protein
MKHNSEPLPEGSPGPARHYRELLDASIADALIQALRIIASDPALVVTGMKILAWQKNAAALRRKQEKEGLLVPPEAGKGRTAGPAGSRKRKDCWSRRPCS